MSNEQNATPGRKSLLDQIHAVEEFAERWGYPDLAEWITKHANEPCPAAIAEFMEMDAALRFANAQRFSRCAPSKTRDQLAAAEKRATDAEALADVRLHWLGERSSTVAALTRKLATVRGLLTSIKKIAGREPLGEWESKVYFEASLGIAAIDAPAGEGASEFDPLTDAELGTPDVIAPPPEPANAQGSEVVCRVGADFDEAHACNKPLPCNDHPQPPSAPRFTAEEARAEAKAIRKSEPLNASVAATLDAYADLLDRDDALERAATDALVVLDQFGEALFDKGTRANLRSVLAQRAKGKQ